MDCITQVYRNLNNGRWSIRQRINGKWRVIGHAASVTLEGVQVRQSEAARQAVIAKGQRSVHCWAYGDLVAVEGFQNAKGYDVTPRMCLGTRPLAGLQRITYNPYEHTTLVFKADGAALDWAAVATFNPAGEMHASR